MAISETNMQQNAVQSLCDC